MPPIPELAHIQGQERRSKIARRLYPKAVARPHGHHRVSGKIEEQVEAVHVGILHLSAQLVPPGAFPQGRRREVAEEHRAQHLLVHGTDKQQHNAPRQQIGVFRTRVNPIGVLGESPAPIDGPGSEGREEYQKVQVVGELHVVDQAVPNLDDHLHRLEGDVRNAQKAHEIPIEHRSYLVGHKGQDDGNDGNAVLPHRLLAAAPTAQYPESGRRGYGKEGGKRSHTLRSLPKEQQQKHHRGRQPIVLDAMPREAEHSSGNDGGRQEDVERRIDVKAQRTHGPTLTPSGRSSRCRSGETPHDRRISWESCTREPISPAASSSPSSAPSRPLALNPP